MADVFADLGLWFSVEPPDDRASVRAGLDALMALNMGAVAEGVETAAQIDLLCVAGCDLMQGWSIGRPLPVAQITALLDACCRCVARQVGPG